MKRSDASVRNATVAVITNLITILIGFVAQKVFSVTLDQEYLGINGLFSNIVSMLAIVELGIGAAIIYNLYKPIAENNYPRIKALIGFYKKTYRKIATIIFILGLCILPFLRFIVGEVQISESIYWLFFLFLLDTIASYLLTYKRSILYANQKNYIINIVHIGYLGIMNALQALFLFTTKNYVIYLVIKIVCRIVENIVLTCIVNKQYPFLKNITEKLDEETHKDINKKIRALVFHKIGEYVVKGTDNIIISKFLGIIAVGLYSGYNMILNALTLLLQQIYDAITASVGNLLVENNEEKSFDIYNKLEFINFWLASFMAISFFCVVTPFVRIWLGDNYLLPNAVVIALTVNFYFRGVRKNPNTFKTAAGIFYEDRFVPIFEALVNLVTSIILVIVVGFPGVFIGTIISNLVLHLYAYPKYVYSKLFKRKRVEYIIKCLKYFVISLITAIITILITNMTRHLNNIFIQVVVNGIICCIVPNIIYILLFYKKDEYKYVVNVFKKVLNKFGIKKKGKE